MVFHFNKAHIQDSSVPPWVIKVKGQTFYVKHVTANAGWSTKETPDNPHTKGSLKFKHVNLEIDDNGEAIINTVAIS